MSELGHTAAPRSRGQIADLIDDDGTGLASAFRRVELGPGVVLFRQGTSHDGLYVVLDGEVQVCRQLPGQRELELARLRAGDLMGEISLLGGGDHTATVRALGSCTLLFLSRTDFDAQTTVGDPNALELKRRIVAIACARLRDAYRALETSLAGTPVLRAGSRRAETRKVPLAAMVPPRQYLSRLALFSGLEADFVTRLLSRSHALCVPRGHVVQAKGAAVQACHVVLNGAVEDVVSRGTSLRRVGFAEPGHACGAVGMLDGEPAPAMSVARERTLLLAIDRHDLQSLLDEPGPGSRALRAAIEADVTRSLNTTERALSQLATETA